MDSDKERMVEEIAERFCITQNKAYDILNLGDNFAAVCQAYDQPGSPQVNAIANRFRWIENHIRGLQRKIYDMEGLIIRQEDHIRNLERKVKHVKVE